MCDKGFIWNRSNCECECDKLCYIRTCLDYKNCKCRKRIIDKLVEECSENIYENKTLYIFHRMFIKKYVTLACYI